MPKTLYTLTFRPSVKIPTGTITLDVGKEQTFIFSSFAERQKTLEWVAAQGWPHSTSIDQIMTDEEARREVIEVIENTCDYFGCALPKLVEK